MFNKQQPRTNYTLMVTKVSNGYVLCLLNDDGETVRTAVASSYALRDYSSHSFCSAVEELWNYAEKLDKAAEPVPPAIFSPVEADAVEYAVAPEIKESRESEL